MKRVQILTTLVNLDLPQDVAGAEITQDDGSHVGTEEIQSITIIFFLEISNFSRYLNAP